MRLTMAGRLAVVTGSSAGIGRGIAGALAASGISVVVNGRDPQRLDAAVARVREVATNRADVRGVAADLATAEGARTLLEAVPQCDILVNNLGIYEVAPFEEIGDADWERLFQTNVMSGVRLTRHYLPGMLERNRGRIVFVSSESGVQIPPEMIHYGMTKAAQIAIARGVAERCTGSAVTVNSVLPGPTWSEGVARFVEALAQREGKTVAELEQHFFAEARPSSVIRRFATTEEVANMVVYLCSEQASATTGAAVRVDGGVIRGIPC